MKIKDTEIKIVHGDLTSLDADAVVVPANRRLTMSFGLAATVKSKGGAGIEREALSQAPVELGQSVWTGAGTLPFRGIVHAVLLGDDESTREDWLRRACGSAFLRAWEQGLPSLVLPDLGLCRRRFPAAGTAKIMAQEMLKAARDQRNTLKVIMVCLDDRETFLTFERTIRGYIDHIQDTLGMGPYVTVDIIIEVDDGIILIERSNPPYGWALPGGFVDCGESLEQAARREAKEETAMDLEDLRQLHTYSSPQRDPRFHTVSTVFVARGVGLPRFGDDAKGLKVVKHSELLECEFAFDHWQVIKDYLEQRGRR